MDVAKLVQGIDATEHFGNVEAGMAVMENTGIIKKRSKISARNIFLGKRGLGLFVSKAKSLEAILP